MALDPSKWSSRRGETLGFEKSFFAKKTRKHVLFYVDGWGPEPCILLEILTILWIKKVHFLGSFFVHLGASCCADPIFMKDFEDFWCFVWAPKKCQKNALDPGEDGSKSADQGPFPPRSYTPIRTCTLKRFVNAEPPRYLKVSLSAIRPYKAL